MSNENDDDLKRREELKREANCDPLQRWKLLQEMINWIETFPSVQRNTRAKCLELQDEKSKKSS